MAGDRQIPPEYEKRARDDRNAKPINVPWPIALAVIVLVFVLVNWLNQPEESKVAPIKADLRSLATAIESYWLDHKAYPAWAVGADGANGHLPPDSAAYRIPTFRIQSTEQGTQTLHTLTTPKAYIKKLFHDPFVEHKKTTFGYITRGAFEEGWIIWSPGPDLDYDIDPYTDYLPSKETPSESLRNHTYDPTNGSISDGDVYRFKT